MIKKEFQKIWGNKLLFATVVIAMCLPILYASIFLKSIWDPYGRINHLPVAVVNLDESTTLEGRKVDVGNQLVDELKKNDDLDWHFVSSKKANQGLKNRKYYMIVKIPKTFSKNAASVLDTDPEKMDLTYETNGGLNFLGQVISENAMTQLKAKVSEQVTKSYADVIISMVKTVGDGMNQAADGANQLADGSTKVSDGLATVKGKVPALTSGVSQLADGSQQLATGVQQYTDGVGQAGSGSQQLAAGLDQLAAKLPTLTNGGQQLADGANQLATQLQAIPMNADSQAQLKAYIAGVNQYIKTINQSLGLLNNLPTAQLAQLGGVFGNIQTQLTQAGQNVQAAGQIVQTSHVQVAQNVVANLPKNADGSITVDPTTLTQAIAQQVGANNQQIGAYLQQTGSNLQSVGTSLQQVNQALGSLAQADFSGLNQLKPATQALAAKTDQATAGLNATVDGLYQVKVKAGAGAAQLANGLNQMNSQLPTLVNGVSQLKAGGQQLNAGMQQLSANSAKLNSGTTQLRDGLATLNGQIPTLADGVNQLADGSNKVKEGNVQLANKLDEAAKRISDVKLSDKTADMIASPDKTTHEQYSEVPNYGHALAPYFMSVSLYVGCLVFNFVYPIRKIADRKNSNATQWFMSKLTIGFIVSTMMALIIGTVMRMIGLTVAQPFNFYATLLITAWLFMFMIMFLAMTFDNPGRFIAVLLLVFQLGSAGGVFPMPLTSHFYNVLNPYMPMTYSIYSLREAISTGLGEQLYRNSMLILFILAVVFVILLGVAMQYLYRKGLAGYSQLHENQKLLDDDYDGKFAKEESSYTLW